jgi:hypothetical protein
LTTRAQKSILFIYPERNQCYSAKNDWKEGTHTCGDEDLQNMQTADAREFLWLGSSCFLLISLTPSKYSSLTAPSSVFEDNNFDGGVCLPQLVANCRPRPDSFSHLVFYGTSSFSYRPAESPLPLVQIRRAGATRTDSSWPDPLAYDRIDSLQTPTGLRSGTASRSWWRSSTVEVAVVWVVVVARYQFSE